MFHRRWQEGAGEYTGGVVRVWWRGRYKPNWCCFA